MNKFVHRLLTKFIFTDIIKLMKTYKNLFEKFVSFDNLLNAYKKARRGKRYRNYAANFYYNLSSNLLEIQRQLMRESYQFGDYRIFYIYEPKRRLIKAPSFRDRVVHHALCNVVEPIFDKKFIFDSYACRKEKGTHRAVKKLQKFLRRLALKSEIRERERERETTQIYAIKMDISKYFASVNHQILFCLIRKKIADPKILNFIKKLIASSSTTNEFDELFPPDSYFRTKRPRGIPIGNLTSQIFANIYLNEVDQFIKHKLKVKYYLRYMDDLLILAKDKKYLHQVKQKIINLLYEQLYLTVNPKKIRIFPVNKGINFLGYVVFQDHILLRASNVKKFRKKYRKLPKKIQEGKISEEKAWHSIQSWIAHAKQANTYHLRKKLFNGKPLPNRLSSGQLRLFD